MCSRCAQRITLQVGCGFCPRSHWKQGASEKSDHRWKATGTANFVYLTLKPWHQGSSDSHWVTFNYIGNLCIYRGKADVLIPSMFVLTQLLWSVEMGQSWSCPRQCFSNCWQDFWAAFIGWEDVIKWWCYGSVFPSAEFPQARVAHETLAPLQCHI